MAELYHTEEEPQYICWDRANYTTFEEQLTAIKNSKTLYIGNLSFFTTETQIYQTFAFAGPVKRVIMGLNNYTKTPCGFTFVEFYQQEHAYNALRYLTETMCDERLFRADFDGGFLPGRQFGRGKSGGQIRDEWRTDYDPARGRFIPPSIMGGRDRDNRGGGGGYNRKRGGESRDDGDGDNNNRNYNNNRGDGGGYHNKKPRYQHDSHHSFNRDYHSRSRDENNNNDYRNSSNSNNNSNNWNEGGQGGGGGRGGRKFIRHQRKPYQQQRDGDREGGDERSGHYSAGDMETTINSSLQASRD
jgi:nuclear cap-binding protein subunit 2